MSEQERKILCKAYARFGTRWPVIAKYYCLRSAEMLQAEYEKCTKLEKLRKSYGIVAAYPPLKELLERESGQDADWQTPHHHNEDESM